MWNTQHELVDIRSLAPGAALLLKKVAAESLPPHERLNTKLCARGMTVQQWKPLVETFSEWPFKPEVRIASAI